MTSLFVSDLHLSVQRPEKIELFKQFLQVPAKQASALYILGDLFDDFWVGCDDQHRPNPEIISSLHEYAKDDRTQLFIMRGNRDFHLNNDFALATGCTLINDPHVITLNNKNVLLMHGDTLCIDDLKYQKWRCFITHPFIKWLYSVMPLGFRKRIAHGVRGYTAEAVQKKAPDIIDVRQNAVLETMDKFAVDTLIHGHTHRQAIHEFVLNDSPAKRIVLGEWYELDCVLIHDETGFRFERVTDYIKNAT